MEGGCIASPSPPAETTWPGWPTTAASVWLMAPREKSECFFPYKSLSECHPGIRDYILEAPTKCDSLLLLLG